MSFSDDMRRFARKTDDSSDRIVRAVTLSLFNGIVRDTPVDTGRARGNWQTDVGAPAESEIDRIDKAGSAAMAEIQAKTPEGAGQVTFLANNLPYVILLENGSSQKAPEGMVRRNMLRIASNLKKAVRSNKV